MALNITLKPHERIVVAGAVITNGPATCRMTVGNWVPILRERNILKVKEANSPARRIYYLIQLMYLDPAELTAYHRFYWKLVRAFIQAAPSAMALICDINTLVLNGRYYEALKQARRLIDREQDILAGSLAGKAARVPFAG
jgi:flagellar biosynthesis repressor protein FlbT